MVLTCRLSTGLVLHLMGTRRSAADHVLLPGAALPAPCIHVSNVLHHSQSVHGCTRWQRCWCLRRCCC